MRSLVALAVLAWSRVALAYQTGSLAGDDCHERLTRHALAEARATLGYEPAAFPTYIRQDALASDLPFETDPYDGFDAIVIVLANREVDLAGLEPSDLDRLAQVHGADENQVEHCLRSAAQDDPSGSSDALESCRAHIRKQVQLAFDGLAADGRPNLEMRLPLQVTLAVRGSVELPLPQFHVALGRAMHALQDSFSHTYRSADDSRVTAVLNYVDLAEAELDPALDGPAHSKHMDECSDLDPLRERRWNMASTASTELALIAFDRSLSRSEKESRLGDLLERYLQYRPGCTAQNEWCFAPEAEFADSEPCTCRNTRSSESWLWLLLLPAFSMLRRRKFLLGFAAILFSQQAEAGDFGVYVSGSGAIMNTALATSVGARYRLANNWVLGTDVEWNPWIGGNLDQVRAGSINAYSTVIFRIPMRADTLSLRSTLQLGVSRIMFDLVGVPEGSIGPYVGLNALGVEWAFTEGLFLVIDPAHVSIPIPKVTGVPFAFPQYRVTIGLQWSG